MRELRQIICAIDRRVPRLERTDEESIARGAAALRDKAFERIATLEAQERWGIATR